jgi:two-component system response regulator AlgR
VAGRAPAVSRPLRIVLVDDEAPARDRLARLIEGIEGAELIGQYADGAGLLEGCAASTPDLALLDVEMPGQDGLALAGRLAELPDPPAIVFVTAFERYAVDAFNVQAADYLVKPVRKERLIAALERVRERLAVQMQDEPTLVARLAERITRIPLGEVRALIAEDKYVSVHYIGGVALVEASLIQLEQRFADRFLRVHRNALVARQHLRALFRDSSGAERVEIDDVEVCPEVSRRNLPVVRRVLKGQA